MASESDMEVGKSGFSSGWPCQLRLVSKRPVQVKSAAMPPVWVQLLGSQMSLEYEELSGEAELMATLLAGSSCCYVNFRLAGHMQ